MVNEMIPDCKVLLFSGQAATVDLLQIARDQGRHFTVLTKPVHPTDLLRCISDALGEQKELIKNANGYVTSSQYVYQ
jgi:DNA-binding NtrC family response regulator